MATMATRPAGPAAAATAAPLDVAALPVKNRGLLMVAVMGASIIQFLDATIANVAIPHMQTSLGATLDNITWVLTGFIIASAVATPITGWLADRVGSRNLFLSAVVGFLVTSALCGIATSLPEMVLFRVFQGMFAALIGPLSQSIMADINPPSGQARAMAIWGMGVMIAPITGPMLGGWLTENYSWRWVFYINLPIGIPTLAILWWLLPTRPIAPRKLDYTGYVLFALGLGALQLMLDRGQGEDWFDSWEVLLEAGIAISALWMFVVHVANAKDPLFARSLWTNRNFVTATMLMPFLGLVMIGVSALLPVMLQRLFGYPVVDSGVLMAPRGIGVLISMYIAARLIGAVGPRVLIGTGFAVAAVTMWYMTGWTLDMGWEQFAVLGLVQGMGFGLVFMPLNVVAFSTIPTHERTNAAGLMNLTRSVGASIGISIATTVLARNIQTSHADIAGNVTAQSLPSVDLSAVDRLGEYGQSALMLLDNMVNRQAAMVAYIDVFWLLTIFVACSVPLVLFMKKVTMAGAAPPPME
jgi:MFS transporter, DHA2 family, multidrug resistance protein